MEAAIQLQVAKSWNRIVVWFWFSCHKPSTSWEFFWPNIQLQVEHVGFGAEALPTSQQNEARARFVGKRGWFVNKTSIMVGTRWFWVRLRSRTTIRINACRKNNQSSWSRKKWNWKGGKCTWRLKLHYVLIFYPFHSFSMCHHMILYKISGEPNNFSAWAQIFPTLQEANPWCCFSVRTAQRSFHFKAGVMVKCAGSECFFAAKFFFQWKACLKCAEMLTAWRRGRLVGLRFGRWEPCAAHRNLYCSTFRQKASRLPRTSFWAFLVCAIWIIQFGNLMWSRRSSKNDWKKLQRRRNKFKLLRSARGRVDFLPCDVSRSMYFSFVSGLTTSTATILSTCHPYQFQKDMTRGKKHWKK